jgi:Ca-activated chloride channel family protein
VITGTAEEKERAFELYDQAIERGDGAFLADQETEDILTVSVGNLKPGQEARVQVRTVSELPVSDGIMRLTIPTSISPRYAPAGTDAAFADRITPDCLPEVPYRLSLEVRVLAEAVRAVRSPSHRITQQQEGAWTVVRLEDGSMRLDRDFVLELERVSARGAVSYLSRHANGERALLLRFYPELAAPAGQEGPEGTRPEVIFLLDCSGSMEGSSIHEARQALELSLRSLEEGDRFNIVRFGSRYEAWRKQPVVYDRRSFEEALRYLRGLDADLGGTELLPALRFACGTRPAEGARREVVLLTDGEVSNPDQVINLARAASVHTRIFSFGIGYGASHALVKGVARASRGAWEMIQPGEAIQPKVLRQFSRLSEPRLEEVRVELEGGSLELSGPLPPVFEGDSVTVFARLAGGEGVSATLRFTGTMEGRTYSWSAPVVGTGDDDAIPCLWARARIKELRFGLEAGSGSNQTDRRQSSVAHQITELGKSYCLLTDYTSFVAVEERAAGERTAGQPEYRRIPVLLTHDYHGTASMPAPDALFAQADIAAPRMRGRMPFAKRASKLGSELIMGRAAFTSSGHEQAGTSSIDIWYLTLLGTQQPEGWFDGWSIPAARLGMTVAEAKKRAFSFSVDWGLPATLSDQDRERLLVTWLAIRLLAESPEASAASRRAVLKARRWLRNALAAHGVEAGKIEAMLAQPPAQRVAELLAQS